jgi:hypothetical protein
VGRFFGGGGGVGGDASANAAPQWQAGSLRSRSWGLVAACRREGPMGRKKIENQVSTLLL